MHGGESDWRPQLAGRILLWPHGGSYTVSHPYWLFFEWLSPLIAFTGIVYTIYLAIMGSLNLPFFLLLFLFVYSFAVTLTTWAVLFEEITFHKYRKKRDVFKLIATAFVEPFFYPVHTYFAVRGNIDVMRGKKSWGKAERSGFQADQPPNGQKKKRTKIMTVRQLVKSGMRDKPVSTT